MNYFVLSLTQQTHKYLDLKGNMYIQYFNFIPLCLTKFHIVFKKIFKQLWTFKTDISGY